MANLWQTVGGYYDATTDYVGDKIENVKEWWAADDEQAQADASGIPGTNDQTSGSTNAGRPLSGVNWTAISAIVGAAALAAKFLK